MAMTQKQRDALERAWAAYDAEGHTHAERARARYRWEQWWHRFEDSTFGSWALLIGGGLVFLFFAVNALWLGLGYFCYAGAC